MKNMKTIKLNIYWIAKLSNGTIVEGRRSAIERITANVKLHIDKIAPSSSDEGIKMYVKASSNCPT